VLPALVVARAVETLLALAMQAAVVAVAHRF
jgi:hypothetical protein